MIYIDRSGFRRAICILVGDTDDTTGRAGTSVASLERLLAVTLTEVVSASVDDDGSLCLS